MPATEKGRLCKMETVIIVLMILVALSFVLKQSFGKPAAVIAVSVVAAVFTGMMWPYAIEQSKSQISSWLSDSDLMLDVAVVMSVEIILQMAFCIMAVNISAEGWLPKWQIAVYKVLRWFPGVLFFPVLFSALTYLIFALPGAGFSTVAWILAGAVLVIVPAGAWLFRKAVPEKDLRLELYFILNALMAIFGVIATVNGQTAVDGYSEVDWKAFAGMVLIILAGAAVGLAWYALRLKGLGHLLKRKDRHQL